MGRTLISERDERVGWFQLQAEARRLFTASEAGGGGGGGGGDRDRDRDGRGGGRPGSRGGRGGGRRGGDGGAPLGAGFVNEQRRGRRVAAFGDLAPNRERDPRFDPRFDPTRPARGGGPARYACSMPARAGAESLSPHGAPPCAW